MFELFVWDHYPLGYKFHLFQVLYELGCCGTEGINSNLHSTWQSAAHLCLGTNMSGRVIDYSSVSQPFFLHFVPSPSSFPPRPAAFIDIFPNCPPLMKFPLKIFAPPWGQYCYHWKCMFWRLFRSISSDLVCLGLNLTFSQNEPSNTITPLFWFWKKKERKKDIFVPI